MDKIGLSEINANWKKVQNFINSERRLPSFDGMSLERELAEFIEFARISFRLNCNFSEDPHPIVCMALIKSINNALDEFESMIHEDSEQKSNETEKSEENSQASEDTKKQDVTEKDYHLNNPKGQEGQQEDENSIRAEKKFRVNKVLRELTEKGLSAFSPEFDFIEDENGELELSEEQKKVLERIRLIQNFLDSQEYIKDEDRKILDADILTQKNLFEQEIKVNRSDNLCKYWDECVLFERNWIDPENPKVSASYFFNFEPKHPEVSAPGSMIIGFDVSDNFVPDLRDGANKELYDKLYSFNKYFHRDVMFFVNRKSIYVLRFGSSSDEPVSSKEEIFDDFWKFFNFVTELCTNTYFQGSKELLEFYFDLKTKLEESN